MSEKKFKIYYKEWGKTKWDWWTPEWWKFGNNTKEEVDAALLYHNEANGHNGKNIQSIFGSTNWYFLEEDIPSYLLNIYEFPQGKR